MLYLCMGSMVTHLTFIKFAIYDVAKKEAGRSIFHMVRQSYVWL